MANIRFYKPALFRKDMDAVLQTMVDEKIGPGEKKREFVKAMAEYLKRKSGFALRTYFDSITLALESLGLENGDGVALSVLTPKIYLEAIKKLSLKPIYVDTDKAFMPSVEEISKKSESIKALILFEPCSQVPANIEEFKSLSIPIIEDITESIGSSFGDIKPGSIGNILLISTEEDCIVSTAGGAVILTDNEEYTENIKKYTANTSRYIELPDLNASLGIVQLGKLDTILERRSNIYRTFQQAIMKSDAVLFGSNNMVDFTSNGSSFAVIVNSKPEDTIAFAQKYSVTAKKTFSNAVGSRYLDRFDLYPNAIAALTRSVSFPLYPFLSALEIETIVKVISHLH